ncbi:MAG: hypothetical protein LBT10_05015 [Methanobrevibacter sp.]|jgi:hypothetical protein|nr:hypothetical protein [Methanobrevibacter sp.]
MKLKIFSLIIIAILAVSAIGSVSADDVLNRLVIHYPDQKNAPGTSGSWRWTGDPITITVEYIGTDSKYHKIYENKNFKKGNIATVDLAAYTPFIDTAYLFIRFEDNTFASTQSSTLRVNNWSPYVSLIINAWDRGAIRRPHFEGTTAHYTYAEETTFNNGDGGEYDLVIK